MSAHRFTSLKANYGLNLIRLSHTPCIYMGSLKAGLQLYVGCSLRCYEHLYLCGGMSGLLCNHTSKMLTANCQWDFYSYAVLSFPEVL